ncbi:hypothetical protein Tco_1309966 [Tanacetum coccineum]
MQHIAEILSEDDSLKDLGARLKEREECLCMLSCKLLKLELCARYQRSFWLREDFSNLGSENMEVIAYVAEGDAEDKFTLTNIPRQRASLKPCYMKNFELALSNVRT